MPSFDIVAPDGRKFRFDAPEGATAEQIQAKAIEAKSALASAKGPAPDISQSVPGAGEVEAGASLLSSMAATPLAGLAGMARAMGVGLANAAGVSNLDPIEEGKGAIERTSEALTYQPRSQAAREAVQAVGKLMEAPRKYVGEPLAEKIPAEYPLARTAVSILPDVAMILAPAAKGLRGAKGAVAAEEGAAAAPVTSLKQAAERVAATEGEPRIAVKGPIGEEFTMGEPAAPPERGPTSVEPVPSMSFDEYNRRGGYKGDKPLPGAQVPTPEEIAAHAAEWEMTPEKARDYLQRAHNDRFGDLERKAGRPVPPIEDSMNMPELLQGNAPEPASPASPEGYRGAPHPSKEPAAQGTLPLRPDKPGYIANLRLSRFDTPKAIHEAITRGVELDNMLDPTRLEEARRGVRTWDQTIEAAKRKGTLSWEDVAERKIGEAYNAEQGLRAEYYLNQAAKDVADMGAAVRNAPRGSAESLEAQAALAHASTKLLTAIEQVAGVKAEAGRALNAQKILLKASDRARGLKAVIDRAGGPNRMEELARMLGDAKTLEEAGQLAKASLKSDSRLFRTYLQILLSNVVTHVKNVTGPMTLGALNEVASVGASGIGAVRKGLADLRGVPLKGDRVALRETLTAARASFDAVEEALTNARKAWDTGENIYGGHGVSGQTVTSGPIEGKYTPLRMLKVEDEFTATVTHREALHRLADRRALEMVDQGKIKPAEADAYARELIKNPDERLQKQVDEYIRYRMMTRPLGKRGQDLSRFLSHNPMRYMAPFRGIAMNIPKTAMEFSPLSPFIKETRDAIRAGGAARDMAIARWGVGTALATWAWNKVMGGNITGGGPLDPGQRAIWAQTHEPYSVKVGDKWVSYAGAEPIAMTIGTVADFHDVYRDGKLRGADLEKAAKGIVAGMAKNLTSKTFLRTMSNFAQAIGSGEAWKMDRFVEDFAGSWVPAGLGSLARNLDPIERETNGIIERAQSRLPVLREGLPPAYDVFGAAKQTGAPQEMKSIGDAAKVAYGLTSPARVVALKQDPLPVELERLGVGIQKAPDKIMDVKLDRDQYAVFAKHYGLLTRQMLEKAMATPEYARASDELRREIVSRTIEVAHKAATPMMIAASPRLQQAIKTKLEERKGALTERREAVSQ